MAEKRLGEPAEVDRRVREFLSSTHDRELRWYSGRAPIPNVRDVTAAADDTDAAPDGGGFGRAPDRGRARAQAAKIAPRPPWPGPAEGGACAPPMNQAHSTLALPMREC